MLWLVTVLQSLTVQKRLKFTNLGKVYDIVIIGGGAAGLYAAAALSSYNKEKGRLDVMLLEKMHRCGLKIGITGKGRCNLTNTKPWNEFATHVHPKNVCLKNAFDASSTTAVMENFEKMGLPLVVERGDRVFPQSMKALDVVATLEKHILGGGVQIRKNAEVSSLVKGDDAVRVIKIKLFRVIHAEAQQQAARARAIHWKHKAEIAQNIMVFYLCCPPLGAPKRVA